MFVFILEKEIKILILFYAMLKEHQFCKMKHKNDEIIQ